MTQPPEVDKNVTLNPQKRIRRVIAIISLLVAMLAAVRGVYWLDEYEPSICRDKKWTRIRNGMSKAEVMRRFPANDGYKIRKRFIPPERRGGGINRSTGRRYELTWEEWNVRYKDLWDHVVIDFSADGRVIGCGCGGA